jgi:DNA-binding NarL/FixJ family response regulator
MFQKILISEDLDSISHSVLNLTDSLGIAEVAQAQYCDDAFLMLQKAAREGNPFELLITDLSYKQDHRAQQFPTGESLLQSVRELFPELRCIVYSIEDRPIKVRNLLEHYGIHAFVCKGRTGLAELGKAIQRVNEGQLYLSPQVETAKEPLAADALLDSDLLLLKMLSEGKSQRDISKAFKTERIQPSSLSYIEKRLQLLRDLFEANNSPHLIGICKDLGII